MQGKSSKGKLRFYHFLDINKSSKFQYFPGTCKWFAEGIFMGSERWLVGI